MLYNAIRLRSTECFASRSVHDLAESQLPMLLICWLLSLFED